MKNFKSVSENHNYNFKDPETERSARVLVRAYELNPMIECDVILNEIPEKYGG